MLGDMLPPCRHSKVGYFSANSAPGVLMEKERYKLNLEEFVLNLGQETRSGAAQLGVCETSAKNRQNLYQIYLLPSAFISILE